MKKTKFDPTTMLQEYTQQITTINDDTAYRRGLADAAEVAIREAAMLDKARSMVPETSRSYDIRTAYHNEALEIASKLLRMARKGMKAQDGKIESDNSPKLED